MPRQARSSRAELVEAGVLRPGRGDLLDVVAVRAPAGVPSSDRLLCADRADR
ncbi:MAG: hypothetical protein FWD74_08160 [Actinomycetia bacterium]|nr:hypothetical protein [Actinomycetes bacterium]